MNRKLDIGANFRGGSQDSSTRREARQRVLIGITTHISVLSCCGVFIISQLASLAARAATYTVPSLTGDSLQQTLNTAYAAGSNNTVVVPAGVYNITSPIFVPCDNGLTVTGPVATPATAVLSASFTGDDIFKLYSCNGVSIEYLGFANTGGMYFGETNHSNITITQNQFMALPSPINGNIVSSGAIYIDGDMNTTLTNFVATWNTFGDPGSCTAVFNSVVDEGGNCIGIHVQAGISINNTVEYNVFDHVEEGVHYAQLLDGSAAKGSNESVTQNLQIRFNYFLNWHRIAIEVQGGIINVGQQISDNVLGAPLNPSWGTMFISDACCTEGRTYLASTAPNPANLTEDNLEWTASPQQVGGFWAPVIGIEYSGAAGSRADNNFIMGDFSNQINWGYGVEPWYVNNNYLCGAYEGEYITQEKAGPMPIISANTEVSTCTQQVSTASTISPASGVYTNPQTITLSNGGRNTSTYYTTDGSTPVPGSGTTQLYTGPFAVTPPATVKAVGMWGVPPQPTSYPAPYGFVPSAVATATYTAAGDPVLTTVSLSATGFMHSLVIGNSLQLTVTCTYSDGSTTDCNSVDSHGNAVSSWHSTSSAVTIDANGIASAISPGTAKITATVAGVTSPAWTLSTHGSPGGPTLTRAYITSVGNVGTVMKGGTLQLSAYGVYSDGSAHLLPDEFGDAVALWNTSNHAVAKVSTMGNVTALSAGTANVVAYIGTIAATPVTITVIAPRVSSSPGTVSHVIADTESDGSTPAKSIMQNQIPEGPEGPVGDPFAGPLWSLTAPAGGSASISQGHLFLGVPGGSNHDALSGANNAVRVVQPIGNENFDVSIEIDSAMLAGDPGTSQGLMLQSDARNYVTFSLDTDGSTIGLSVHTVVGGTPTTVFEDNQLTEYQTPFYLRLTRSGGDYGAFYSTNGEDWIEAARFIYSAVPTAMGPFAANYSLNQANAVPVVMSVGSFDSR